MGKLQPRQAVMGGKHRRLGQGNPAAHIDRGPLRPLQPVEAPRQFDEKAVHPLIRHQKVGALPQKEGGDPSLERHTQELSQVGLAPGQGHQRRGTAHPKGGMQPHRLLFPQLQVRQLCFEFGLEYL